MSPRSSGSACKPKKLGKRLQALIDRLTRGEKLCKSVRKKETGEPEVLFHYEPSGRSAPPGTALKAISGGHVKPTGDGLFGDDTSQTWVAA